MSRATFRDFEFLTESHDAKSGRRLVVHEHPGSDVPNVEDFGLKAWDWSLNAYFIGPDYDRARNKLLTLLAEPGPDWLIHPWLGTIWVRVKDWSVSESNDKGGYCSIKIELVPGGEIRQPELDYSDVAQAACQEAATAAVEYFDLLPMSADALQSYVAAVQQRLESLRKIISLATLPLAWTSSAISSIQGLKHDLGTIAAVPASYANTLLGVAHSLGLSAGDGRDIAADLKPGARAGIVGRIGKTAGPSRRAVTITGASTSDVALLSNLRAEFALEQRLFVSAAMSVAVAPYPSEADRDQALAAVDQAVSGVLYAAPDSVFQPLVTARSAVIEALLAQDLRQGVTRNIVRPLPAVLIAHNLGVPEEDFLARNAVRHPLFVNGVVHG
ncbi:MAG: DNA circularization N-terminal domain-containing protein [Rhodanobacter sp.]|jgi:prophage DNA circulation protein|nr:DNA circularization N-terminal domain-containing protein [Rhodanobacter sp.]